MKFELPLVLIFFVFIFVIVMSLIPGSVLPYIYVGAGNLIGISPQWVHANIWQISNYGHLLTSAVLTYLVVLRFKEVWFSLFILILASFVAIECIQYYVPDRQASWVDFLYDLSGSLLGLFFAYIHIRRFRLKTADDTSIT